ncbi:MAG: hypothetical protein JNJ59_20710, partial [Deltaproteobacteria bacterium]|nr:hypothetical protein [Deltaproteobacteria bacterium]
WGFFAVLSGPERVSPRACAKPPAAAPTVTVRVVGRGKVELGALGACEGECVVPGTLFERLHVAAVPGAGQRLAAWSGACAGVGECDVWLDQDLTIEARFVATELDAVADLGSALLNGPMLVATTGGAVLASGVHGELKIGGDVVHAAGADATVVVGLDAALARRWSLEIAGVLPIGLSATADGVMVAVEASPGVRVRWLDDAGAVSGEAAVARQATNWRVIADASGATFASYRLNDAKWQLAGLGATGETFTVALTSTPSVSVLGLVPLAEGAAALVLGSGELKVGAEVIGTTGLVLVTVDAQGAVSAHAVAAGAPGEHLMAAYDGLWLAGLTTRDGALPAVGAYLEPIAATGALRGAAVAVNVPVSFDRFGPPPIWPLQWSGAGRFVVAATLAARAVDGVTVETYGQGDLGVFALGVDGKALTGESLGGAGVDRWLATAAVESHFVGLAYLPGGGTVGGRAVSELVLVAKRAR